ncbi:MAG: Ig-like domain-containing protein, partial [Armatimonadota bacterium]
QATATVRNNIVAFSAGGGVRFYLCTITIAYCDVYGNTGGNYYDTTDQTGSNGNLSSDPLFANAAGGDFHEKAMAGRWNGSGWVSDPVTSPCVDAGDPAASYANEPAPNGSRVNMGAYGNTTYASKSGSAASPPTVVCATFVDANHVNLTFTKALNAGTVGAVGNYSVTPSLGVTAATLDGDTKTVHLTTAAQTLSATYIVTVSGVKDTLGNAIVAGSGDTASWTPSALVPTVIAALPTGTKVGAEKVTLTTAFSTAMNKASAEGALSITPAQAGGAAHGWPGTFVWIGNQMQYKLSTALAPLTTYKVTISTAAQSAGGAKLASSKTWSFTTTAAPAVASYTPTGTAVPRSSAGRSVRIAFNQPMNKASAQGALWLYLASATPSATPTRPAGSFSWVGNEMRYTLKSKLAAKTRYTVKLGPGVKSATGVARTTTLTWSFTTGAATSAPATVTVAAAPSAAGAQITVNLSAAANVQVQVRNLAGREVAVVNAGELEAGVQTLLWNGKSRTGTRVPAGMYLLEVSAHAADGASAQAMTSLSLR